jgi:DNA-binding transcriptional LysR family regulator
MDRLQSMAVFVKVVDLGSLAAAASALGLSAPMVGKHVRHLEDRLRVRLLNRTTRRQSLTEFGRAYYERCRLILAEAEAADALAADHLLEPRGRLRVAMPVLFGRHSVAPILLALAGQYPALEIELAFSDRLVDINEGNFDLAVRTGNLQHTDGIVARLLASQRMIVCAAPAYIAERGRLEALADLGAHDTIAYSRSARTPPWLFPRADGGAPEAFVPSSRLRLDDMEAIADAAVAGMGLAWLPSWLVRDRLQSGALVRLLPGRAEFLYDCHALRPQAPHVPRKVRLAIDALAAALPALMQ